MNSKCMLITVRSGCSCTSMSVYFLCNSHAFALLLLSVTSFRFFISFCLFAVFGCPAWSLQATGPVITPRCTQQQPLLYLLVLILEKISISVECSLDIFIFKRVNNEDDCVLKLC